MAILELQRIDESNDFEAWWNRLLSRSLDNHPFLTYEWLTSWWKYFGKGRELRLFTSENRGEISLVAPLMYSKQKVIGSAHCNVGFAASPDADYQVFLVSSFQNASMDVKQLVENIMEDSNADIVVFSDVPEDSTTARLLESVNTEKFLFRYAASDSCPYIPLSGSYDAYLQSLTHNMRRALKVTEKQALRDFRVDFIKYDKIGEVKDGMNIFFNLHQKREIAKGNCGLFSNELYRSFHSEIADAFAEKGWLALFFLTFNDEPVSALYAYEYNGKLYAYLSGFDPEYSNYRPGYMIIRRMIQYAAKKGLREFDFLRGAEQYKNRWGTNVRKNYEYQFARKGFKSRFYNWGVHSSYCCGLYRLISRPVKLLQKR
jgi:CelD/BcsL family acetyltransferase involved in cellulose biosynthesis